MMSTERGWQLPANIYPEGSWCYSIIVPRDIGYLRALRGAIGELAYHWNWQKDGSTNVEEVVQVWLQQITDAEARLVEGDCSSLIDCNDVVLCVQNSTELRDAIQQAVAGLPNTQGDPARIATEAFEDASCNNDALYGYSKALWQYIDGNTVDFLELMAEATNLSEQLSKLITLIPGMELLPVDEVLGWVESFGNYNLEAYNSSKTVGLEQEIICDLFCLSQENCSLDFGQVYDYFIGKLGGVNAPTAIATFAEWVYFMAVGNYPTDRIVYLWSAFQLGLAFIGQEFLNLSTIKRYAMFAQAGDPDNEWSILCDPCEETWTSTLDFTVSSHGVAFLQDDSNNDIGQWVNGVGLKPVNNVRQSTQSTWLYFWLDFDLANVTEVSWVANFTRSEVQQTSLVAYTLGLRNNTIPDWTSFFRQRQYSELQLNAPVDISETQTDSPGENANQLLGSLRPEQGAYGGDCVVTSVTIKGTGTKPAQLP